MKLIAPDSHPSIQYENSSLAGVWNFYQSRKWQVVNHWWKRQNIKRATSNRDYQLIKTLVDLAKSQNKQLIMTTQSEHIAFALFKAVQDKQLEEEALAIYGFRVEKYSPSAVVERIKTIRAS